MTPNERLTQPDPFMCPRCDDPLELIEGWIEYGDQLVMVERLGCWKCGYREGGDDDGDDGDE